MKCGRRGNKNKSKKVWMPRGTDLIPPHKVIKSKKAYDRKQEKRWCMLHIGDLQVPLYSNRQEDLMKMKNKLKSILTTSGLVLSSVLLLSGCMAAAIPLMIATQAVGIGMGAFAVTKTVQLSTGGSVEMGIGENEAPGQNKRVLADISKLAIWPGDEAEVFTANKLQGAKAFDLIVTPSKVGRAINQSNLDREIRNLTQTEMLQTFQTVCQKTGAEAVVAFKNLGMESHTNAWSFDRPSVDFKGRIFIYAVQPNQIIFSSTAQMKMHLGGSTPNQQEVREKAGEMLADKLIELRQGK